MATRKKKTVPRRRAATSPRTTQPKLRAPRSGVNAAAAATYELVCKIALRFPGVELSTSYGTPSIKVKGKIMSRLRSEAEGGLALRCDFVDRQMLMQAAPEAFYLTDHYRDHPMVLIHLDHVRRDALPDLIERAWRMVAPSKLVASYDAVETR